MSNMNLSDYWMSCLLYMCIRRLENSLPQKLLCIDMSITRSLVMVSSMPIWQSKKTLYRNPYIYRPTRKS